MARYITGALRIHDDAAMAIWLYDYAVIFMHGHRVGGAGVELLAQWKILSGLVAKQKMRKGGHCA